VARAVIDTMRPHILLPDGHRLAGESSVSLAELAEEPQVLLDAPPSSHNTLAIFERFGITPDVRFRPTTFELTRALVGRGMGYALLVQRPANDRTYEGNPVVIKEISEPVGEARVLVAWPKAMRLNRRAQAFVEFLSRPLCGRPGSEAAELTGGLERRQPQGWSLERTGDLISPWTGMAPLGHLRFDGVNQTDRRRTRRWHYRGEHT
jgi:hypothetical protein